jgi:CheY-like chemotaxis protein
VSAQPPTTLRVVLVVDDNQDAADSLAQLLRGCGHQVEVAYNGMCALARVRSCHPDVVLCDLGWPELSGYDFARAVRREQTGTIRLVAISGYAQPEDIRRSLEAGFDAHVAKPAQASDIEYVLA